MDAFGASDVSDSSDATIGPSGGAGRAGVCESKWICRSEGISGSAAVRRSVRPPGRSALARQLTGSRPAAQDCGGCGQSPSSVPRPRWLREAACRRAAAAPVAAMRPTETQKAFRAPFSTARAGSDGPSEPAWRKMVPRRAIPSVPPSCWAALSSPAAEPVSCGRTRCRAVVKNGTANRPCPEPQSRAADRQRGQRRPWPAATGGVRRRRVVPGQVALSATVGCSREARTAG